MKSRDLQQAAVAQLMLESAQKHMVTAQSQLEATRQEQRTVNKRKQTALIKFISQIKRTSDAGHS